MSKRRVVITGMGIVSPVGSRLDDAWRNVCEGNSGIGLIEEFDANSFPTRIAGTVAGFEIDDYMSPKDQRKNDPFIHYGVAASADAIRHSGLEITEENGHRIGVAMGSGIGGIKFIADNHDKFLAGGQRKVSPFFIPGSIINMTSGQVSIMQHITGPNISIVTACATSTHCIGFAGRCIEHGDAEVMLAGGSEYATTPLAMGGFCSARAMSTRNDDPAGASRPWDVDRDGFVLSNGAGCVVLEELEHARARGATIYAELIGFGMSGDAYHITLPPADGEGARKCMTAAIRDAGIDPADIEYLNAHGTSTPAGDIGETVGIRRTFGMPQTISWSVPRNRRPDTCWVPPASQRLSSQSSQSETRLFHRPSTWRTRIPSATSITYPMKRGRRRWSRRSRILSVSAARTAVLFSEQ